MSMRKKNLPQKPKTKILEFPLDLRPTMYEAIGEYMARAARLEFHLISGISLLAGITNPKKQRIAFMGMTFNARLGTFKALATYWAPNKRIRDQIYSVVAAARKIRITRNSLAHGAWSHEVGGDPRKLHVYFAPDSKDYYLPAATHYTSDQLRAKARSIRALNIRLGRVLKALTAAKIP